MIGYYINIERFFVIFLCLFKREERLLRTKQCKLDFLKRPGLTVSFRSPSIYQFSLDLTKIHQAKNLPKVNYLDLINLQLYFKFRFALSFADFDLKRTRFVRSKFFIRLYYKEMCLTRISIIVYDFHG